MHPDISFNGKTTCNKRFCRVEFVFVTIIMLNSYQEYKVINQATHLHLAIQWFLKRILEYKTCKTKMSHKSIAFRF